MQMKFRFQTRVWGDITVIEEGSGYRVRIKILFQRLRCKHLNQECITNFGGDMINLVSSHHHIYRSAWRCRDCGEIIYNEKLEPTCKITNWTLIR